MAATALLLAGPARSAQAGEHGDGGAAAGAADLGMPFSMVDMGWVFIATIVLVTVWWSLQLVVRCRPGRLRAATRERTDP